MNGDTGPVHELARYLAGDGADYDALRATWPDLPTDRRAALLWVQGRPDLAGVVFQADPAGDAPQPDAPQPDAPELPAYARLEYDPASGAGAWLDRYTTQARAVSPMTPLLFHESAALWLAGVAIARRLVLPLAFGDIYPNLFVLWLAPTTLYRKSTGLNFARDLARRAFPHLLTPQDTTPEAFLSDLAGAQPANFASLSQTAAARWEQGRKFAAQKGLCLDELSGLLAGAGKDYNAGLLEALLRLYDCDPDFTRSTRNAGWLTVRNGYLSLLGASTPAALAQHLQSERLWSTGFWPRFAILTPAARPEWATAQALDNAPDLVADLCRLADRLPAGAVDNPPVARPVTLGGGVYEAWGRYNKAVSFDLLTPDLEARLYGTYGRLPGLALKVAVILAALDWPAGLETPQVTLSHLARALSITEAWRASAHRALLAAAQDETDHVKRRVLCQIGRAEPNGATVRDLCRAMQSTRTAEIEAALHDLVTAGEVEAVRQQSGQQGGRPTERYRLVRG